MGRTVWGLVAALAGVVTAGGLDAQATSPWNDPRALDLVRRATERRAEQLADTGLLDYRARAHGYVTFLAQLGEGFPEPPKVLKADELVLEVYWRVPNLSKQRIIGRRDTLLLATDINYHRDHLGIVQNNFPEIIRLGDGDEVKDVPHPLSRTGASEYDFAITDSLTINLGNRELEVYEVRFRPKDDRLPRAVGAIYLDRAEGQVARMTFGFTRSALVDNQLDDVSIVLDNGLVEGRFWLPRRQSIEIRRSGSWMDFPARGIIRGRWEICCVEVNQGLAREFFAGPEIVSAPQAVLASYRWEGKIVDSLPPDITLVREQDVRKVQADARALIRGQALERSRAASLSARRFSDLVRVNRVEGLAIGLGIRQRLGNGFSAALRGRYGTADRRGKWGFELRRDLTSGGSISLSAFRDWREAGDIQETSGLRNSIAAQEFGVDATDPYGVRGASIRVGVPGPGRAAWFVEARREATDPLAIHATPARGAYAPTLAAWRAVDLSVEAGLERALQPLGEGPHLFGGRVALRAGQLDPREPADPGAPTRRYARAVVAARGEWPGSGGRFVLDGSAATLVLPGGIAVSDPRLPGGLLSDFPPQLLVHLGGPVTGPGYRFHEFSGELGAQARAEWQMPVPFFRVPLGRFGRTSNRAVIAPFAHMLIVAGGRNAGVEAKPSVGVGLLTLFDLLRLDVARGMRDGRWRFGADVSSSFWGIL